ncbi:MAG: c-type cytochrome biogenesis protein CcsB [Chloroflexi bacterium]|jgi:cytochrome c-type biogenesis protein CcsB|nr:c-type cytochrome biogenesis protein CcsB [Chloroflexota bacterium]
MDKMAMYAFLAGTLSTFLALIAYVFYAISGVRAARMATAGAPMTTGRVGFVSGPRTASIGHYATLLGWLGFALIGASLVFRAIATGHGPFSNMYEFSIAFAWGILGAYYWFEHKYHQRMLGLLALPVALGMLLYASTIPADIEPLVPALQNNLLLSVHVATAIVAYGSFTVAFAAAVLYLAQPESGRWGLPKPAILDEIGYRAIVVGFPFLTLVIVLGALWADVAWGRYWGWDPKETASLVTWFIYGAYLHARVMRGWRGRKAAILLIVGFGATLLTYFGNLFFGGLHSYSGLG